MHQPLLLLFAQKKGPPPELVEGLGLFVVATVCVSVLLTLVMLTFMILHIVAMYKALGVVAKRNRTMEPGMVFLVFVPVLALVWQFLVVMRVAESLRNEYEDRGWDTENESFGYGMGLTMAILNVAGCIPVNVIFLIIHWRQISGYYTRLAGLGRGSRRR